MPGCILFNLPKVRNIDDRAIADRLVKRVRIRGEKDGVKIPRNISYGGMYGSYIDISFTSNAMRDILIAESKKIQIKDKKLSIERII